MKTLLNGFDSFFSKCPSEMHTMVQQWRARCAVHDSSAKAARDGFMRFVAAAVSGRHKGTRHLFAKDLLAMLRSDFSQRQLAVEALAKSSRGLGRFNPACVSAVFLCIMVGRSLQHIRDCLAVLGLLLPMPPWRHALPFENICCLIDFLMINYLSCVRWRGP